MSITNPAKRLHRASPWMHGPELAFGGTLLIAFAAMVAGTKMLPGDLVLPVVSTIFFVLACLVALVAMLRERTCDQRRMTYWDVAGALTLFGICVASQVDADQMVRLVEGAHREQ
jgi:uncharacterized membrane protein YhaH (DUF805 family)